MSLTQSHFCNNLFAQLGHYLSDPTFLLCLLIPVSSSHCHQLLCHPRGIFFPDIRTSLHSYLLRVFALWLLSQKSFPERLFAITVTFPRLALPLLHHCFVVFHGMCHSLADVLYVQFMHVLIICSWLEECFFFFVVYYSFSAQSGTWHQIDA